MQRKFRNVFLFALILNGLHLTSIIAQEKQEIILTLTEISTEDKIEHFTKGEELRKQMKFNEAIEEYQKVMTLGESCGKESEAHYDIGLCYLWLMKLDIAEAVFHEVITIYPDNREVIAFSRYCLSWIDVQRGNFYTAIDRLRCSLAEDIYSDEEYCSKAQFQIGRIYLVFLHDDEKAEEAFRTVLEKYPNSSITNHPFLQNLKGEY